jgi:hypothetical protein
MVRQQAFAAATSETLAVTTMCVRVGKEAARAFRRTSFFNYGWTGTRFRAA